MKAYKETQYIKKIELKHLFSWGDGVGGGGIYVVIPSSPPPALALGFREFPQNKAKDDHCLPGSIRIMTTEHFSSPDLFLVYAKCILAFKQV